MMKKLLITVLFAFTIFLVGCGSNCEKKNAQCCGCDAVHIAALNNNLGYSTQIGVIRLKAITETATLVGAQGGLAWRAEQINCVLKRRQQTLDEIYNFRALMLKDDVRPPVLEEGERELTLDSCDAIRAADHIFRIICPPCFVTAPPDWREYIWMKFCQPETPDITLLPKCKDEAAIWNCYVNIGWQQGVDQANLIFRENLDRLKRDYNGMLLYRKLLAQNMVTPPYVAKTELGVTGDANELRINDRVLRISATSELNTRPETWRPAVGGPCASEVCTAPASTNCVIKKSPPKKKAVPPKKKPKRKSSCR